MTQEEIKKKAKEIAEANGRTYRDQEYGDINTEEECYDSAIEMAEYVIAETDIDEKHKIGKWFMGLIPCWVDAPSTLQAAHDHHGKNIVAIHLKNGGYRCCCVDDKKPTTFSLAENTPLVEGWHNRESSWNEKDKKIIKNILSVLDAQECYDGATGKKMNPYQKEIDWLKSLNLKI